MRLNRLKEIFEEVNTEVEEEKIHLIEVSLPADMLKGMSISLESQWRESGYKDWMFRVDPEDPRIPLKRHVHISREKHTSSKDQQASWNEDGTRHDKSSFNEKVGNKKVVRDVAAKALGIPSTLTLESIHSEGTTIHLKKDVIFTSESSALLTIDYA